jgi:hypothetical protein
MDDLVTTDTSTFPFHRDPRDELAIVPNMKLILSRARDDTLGG